MTTQPANKEVLKLLKPLCTCLCVYDLAHRWMCGYLLTTTAHRDNTTQTILLSRKRVKGHVNWKEKIIRTLQKSSKKDPRKKCSSQVRRNRWRSPPVRGRVLGGWDDKRPQQCRHKHSDFLQLITFWWGGHSLPFVSVSVSARPTYFVFSLCPETVSPGIFGWVVLSPSPSLLSLVESPPNRRLKSASSWGVALNTLRSPWPSRLRPPQ